MSNMIALVSLDFGGAEACVASAKELTPMDAQLVKATIKAYLTEIRNVPCVAVNAFCSLGNVSVSLSVFTDGL
jgi:hypothetical protein